MKYCEEYAALLDLFVDGELPPGEMARVQAHLENCPGCRAYVDDALAIRAGFPDTEDTVVPEGFAEGVMERIRRDAERERKVVELKRKSIRRRAGTLGALAACCALVVLVRSGSGGWNGSRDTAETVTAGAGESVSAAYDTNGDVENGIAPQAAMEEAQDRYGAVEEPAEEKLETRMTSMDGERRDSTKAAERSDCGELPTAASPAEAAPETEEDVIRGGEAALYLTAEEAGELLDGFAPVWEDSVSSRYELSAEEYRALLEALGRPEELQGTEERTFAVVVKWALE